MAPTNLHDDVLHASEECRERAAHRACAYDDSLVGSLASTRGCEVAMQMSN